MSSKVVNGECSKCNGSGHIVAFSHIKGGECFGCGGTGKVAAEVGETTVAMAADGRTEWMNRFERYTVAQVVEMFQANLTWTQIWKIHGHGATEFVAWKAARQIMMSTVAA